MKRKKLTSQQIRKKTKRKLKSLGKRSRTFINLICKNCKREFKIRTNDKSIYTKEVISKWLCLVCSCKLKRI